MAATIGIVVAVAITAAITVVITTSVAVSIAAAISTIVTTIIAFVIAIAITKVPVGAGNIVVPGSATRGPHVLSTVVHGPLTVIVAVWGNNAFTTRKGNRSIDTKYYDDVLFLYEQCTHGLSTLIYFLNSLFFKSLVEMVCAAVQTF